MGGLTIEAAFLLGAAGAAAPEILRLYELRTNPDQFQWSWKYLLLTGPFLVLGGLVSVILPATTVWGAFYAGLSLPITISAATKKLMGDGVTGSVKAATRDETTPSSPPLTGFRAYISALY